MESILLFSLIAAAVLGLAAAFFWLAVLAFTHLWGRGLWELLGAVERQAEKQEQLRKRGADAPLLARYDRLRNTVRQILAREGFRRPAPPRHSVPPPAPTR